MNKGELIEAVAKDAGISKTLAGTVLDTTIDTITKSLSRGDRVTLVGFGNFSVSSRKARSGKNPQTGQTITIPPTKFARFKPANKLAQAVK